MTGHQINAAITKIVRRPEAKAARRPPWLSECLPRPAQQRAIIGAFFSLIISHASCQSLHRWQGGQMTGLPRGRASDTLLQNQ